MADTVKPQKTYETTTGNLLLKIYRTFTILCVVNFIVFWYLLSRYNNNDTSISQSSMIAFIIMLLLFWSAGLFIYARLRYALWANPINADGQYGNVDQRFNAIMAAAQKGYIAWLRQADVSGLATTGRPSVMDQPPMEDELQQIQQI